MSLPFTSVVSLHTDPHACGVGNFSQQLAKHLNVPCVPLSPDPSRWGHFPLLSLKWSEFHEDHKPYTRHHCYPLGLQESGGTRRGVHPYGVFWHDAGDPYVTEHAHVVYYADPSLGPNGLWCPPLIAPAPYKPVRLFTFGMAGRTQLAHFARAKALLDAQGIAFHLRVSAGLHEGTSLSTALEGFSSLKDCLGPERVTVLGILSDEAVAEEIRDCDYVLAFFEKGVRANNSTVQSALAAGKTVVTNHDAQTPGFLKASTRDITTRDRWENPIPYFYSWERLIEKMTEQYAATTDRHAQHLG